MKITKRKILKIIKEFLFLMFLLKGGAKCHWR